ncbi:MAG: ABC transporter permease [Acidobacteriaceae bacterium]
MWNDLKFAVRQLRKSPGFAVAAVLTLAIGIGANTAIFSVMDAIVLRPLAVPDMSRVVTVDAVQNGGQPVWVTLGNYEDWARQSRSFEQLAIRTDESLSLTGAGEAAHVQTTAVSPNFFGLLKVRPLLGRDFRADEAQPGRDGEAVLSYGFWQRHFGGESGVIGRHVELDDRAYTVIGVMPKTLGYPQTADLFLPLAPTASQMHDRTSRNYLVLGRLRPGVTVLEAQAEMQGIAARLAKAYPATNLGWSVKVAPLLDSINGMTPLYMRLLMGATLVVLLIVCANVANLQFARGLGRRNEMAVRSALGARRVRLLRQLLAESVLLGLAGAAGGLMLAKLDLQIMLNNMPAQVARYVAGWGNISLNRRALALSVVLAVAAGVISGLAPALEALRLNLVEQLKAGGRTATSSRGAHRLRNVFAVAQIALAVALVIGAALMAKGMEAMLHRSDVYGPKQMLTFNVDLPPQRYSTAAKQAAWYADSLSRIEMLPGVKSAAVTTFLPNGNDGTWEDSFRIDSRPVAPGQAQNAARLAVSANYFDTMHIPVVEGRAFDASDGLNTTPVAIVSRKFAARYFPGTSPLGHKIRMGNGKDSDEPWVTIAGVAGDVQYDWTDPAPEPAIYLDTAQLPPTSAKYVVVTAGDPLAVAPDIRRALAAIDATLPLDAMQTYAEYLHDALVGLMYVASYLVLDAAIALLLAGIGIFGVMANLVGERRREIGVRLTMGASRKDVLQMFLRRAAILTGIGLVIGVPLAAGLARMLANLLFGVRPGDIAVFATTSIAIAGISLLAAYFPARRAAQVDPLESLRSE